MVITLPHGSHRRRESSSSGHKRILIRLFLHQTPLSRDEIRSLYATRHNKAASASGHTYNTVLYPTAPLCIQGFFFSIFPPMFCSDYTNRSIWPSGSSKRISVSTSSSLFGTRARAEMISPAISLTSLTPEVFLPVNRISETC